MKINKKIVLALAGLVGLSGILATTPSFAYGHYHPYYPHYRHHGGGGLAAGLFFGTAVGLMAAAAMDHNDYYASCQRVYYDRYCRYNGWGDRTCYVVRHVRYVC